MRLRISYTGPTGPVLEQTEVNNFPSLISQWQDILKKTIVHIPV